MPERDRGQGACCGSCAAAVRQLCGSGADPAAGASNERPLPLRSHDVPFPGSFPGGLSSGMHAARRAPRDAPLASRSSTITPLTTPLTRRIPSSEGGRVLERCTRARLRGDNTHSHLDSLDEKENSVLVQRIITVSKVLREKSSAHLGRRLFSAAACSCPKVRRRIGQGLAGQVLPLSLIPRV